MPETFTFVIEDKTQGQPPQPRPAYAPPPSGAAAPSPSAPSVQPAQAVRPQAPQQPSPATQPLTGQPLQPTGPYQPPTQPQQQARQPQRPIDVLPGNAVAEAYQQRAREMERARKEAAYQNLFGKPGEAIDPRAGARRETAGLVGSFGGPLGGAVGGTMAGGATAAAGIAGGIMFAVEEARRVIREGRERARGDIRTVGGAASAAGGLDTGQLAGAAEQAAERLLPFGELVGETSRQFRGLIQSVDATARRLSAFNAPLAAAEARADVRQVLGDIRRAQQLGPDLARFVDARSRLEQRGQDILADLLKPWLPRITQLVENIDAVLGAGKAVADKAGGVDGIMSRAGGWLRSEAGAVLAPGLSILAQVGAAVSSDSDLMGWLRQIAGNTKKEGEGFAADWFFEVMRSVPRGRVAVPGEGARPPRGQLGPGINLPAFRGVP